MTRSGQKYYGLFGVRGSFLGRESKGRGGRRKKIVVTVVLDFKVEDLECVSM